MNKTLLRRKGKVRGGDSPTGASVRRARSLRCNLQERRKVASPPTSSKSDFGQREQGRRGGELG